MNQEPALVQAERRVSVELHPVTSLGLGGVDTPSLQGVPDETTGSGITPSGQLLFDGNNPLPLLVDAEYTAEKISAL